MVLIEYDGRVKAEDLLQNCVKECRVLGHKQQANQIETLLKSGDEHGLVDEQKLDYRLTWCHRTEWSTWKNDAWFLHQSGANSGLSRVQHIQILLVFSFCALL